MSVQYNRDKDELAKLLEKKKEQEDKSELWKKIRCLIVCLCNVFWSSDEELEDKIGVIENRILVKKGEGRHDVSVSAALAEAANPQYKEDTDFLKKKKGQRKRLFEIGAWKKTAFMNVLGQEAYEKFKTDEKIASVEDAIEKGQWLKRKWLSLRASNFPVIWVLIVGLATGGTMNMPRIVRMSNSETSNGIGTSNLTVGSDQ